MDPLAQSSMEIDISNIEWLVTHPGEYDPETDAANPIISHEAKSIVLALCQIARMLARLTWDYEYMNDIEHESLVKE